MNWVDAHSLGELTVDVLTWFDEAAKAGFLDVDFGDGYGSMRVRTPGKERTTPETIREALDLAKAVSALRRDGAR